MRGLLISLAALSLCAPAVAGEPAGKTVLDLWDAAYLRGNRAGYVHTITEEFEKDGQTVFRTIVELRLKVRRNSDLIELAMDSGTWETPEGKVVGTFMRQYLGKQKRLGIVGTVEGDQLKLQLDTGKPLHPAPWTDDVIGLYRQQTLFKDRAVKPGDEFSYPSFEPSINLVLNSRVTVKDFEEVDMPGGNQKRRLLRVETKPEQVQNVQLPALVSWLDENRMPLRSEVDIPLLDKVVLYRTTKAGALSPVSLAQLPPDIGLTQLIKLKRRVGNPYDTTAAVYRVQLKDDADPASAFAQDGRQQAKNVKGQTFELHVQAQRGPAEGDGERPGAEAVQSSYFINSADPRVRQLAKLAVGAESDPLRKALRIEQWVHDRMRVTNQEALAPADQVARTLEGDCTEFAMLTAAMCRAEGVPSRTAVGLIYADVRGQPSFAFHMWTEVWVRGGWLPLDATLGKGYVGATHLKICDQTWHNTRDMTPLFPVVRVLGRVNIDVLDVRGR